MSSASHGVAISGKTTVDWNRLPNRKECSFTESTRVRQITSKIFAAAGVGAAGSAGYLAYGAFATGTFVATPIVATIMAGLALFSLAMAIAAWYINQLQPSLNDPEQQLILRRQFGPEIERNLRESTYGYLEISKRYTDQRIVSNADINNLIRHDAANLPYGAFIMKHGRSAFNFLDPENYENVRKSFIKHLETECFGKVKLSDIQNHPDYVQFKIQEIEIAQSIALAECNRLIAEQGSYLAFVQRLKPEAVSWITDMDHRQYLADKFKEHIAVQNIGVEALKRDYPFALNIFGQEVESDLCRQIIEKEFRQYAGNYIGLRTRSSLKSIKAHAQSNQNIHNQLRNDFLQLSDQDLLDDKYREDRQYLGIDNTTLKNVLSKRWEGLNIQHLLQNPAFAKSLTMRVFSNKDWTQRALDGTAQMSMKFVAENYPFLIQQNILYPTHPKVVERFESELSLLKSFEDLAAYPQVVFECGVFALEAVQKEVARLVSQFLAQKIDQFIWTQRGLNTADKLLRALHSYPSLIPSEIAQGPLVIAEQNFHTTMAKFNAQLAQHKDECRANVAAILQTKDTAVKQLQAQIDGLSGQIVDVRVKRDNAAQNVDELIRERGALQQELIEIDRANQKVLQEIADLQQKVLEYTHKIQGLPNVTAQFQRLELTINQIKSMILHDQAIRKLESQINDNKENKQKLSNELRQLKEKEPLQRELTRLRDDHTRLERKVDDDSHEVRRAASQVAELDRQIKRLEEEKRRSESHRHQRHRHVRPRRSPLDIEFPSLELSLPSLEIDSPQLMLYKSDRDSKQRELSRLESSLQAKQAELDKNQKRIAALESQLPRDLTSEIRSKERQILELDISIRGFEQQKDQAILQFQLVHDLSGKERALEVLRQEELRLDMLSKERDIFGYSIQLAQARQQVIVSRPRRLNNRISFITQTALPEAQQKHHLAETAHEEIKGRLLPQIDQLKVDISAHNADYDRQKGEYDRIKQEKDAESTRQKDASLQEVYDEFGREVMHQASAPSAPCAPGGPEG